MCDAVTQSFAPLPTEINPNFLTQINDCFIPSAAVYGYSLRITSGFRTVAEQNQIYNQGRNDDGDIVTEAPGGRSIHNFGYAADVVDSNHEYNINWKRLAKIGAFCGLEAGDDWDFAHYEYRGGLTTADFVTGSRPSPLMLPCAVMQKRAKDGQPLTLKDLQNCGAPKF
ncbi:MAG: M15 family metallopeptidase [Patescibacteria group bacterium]